jgi:NAD(P)-dependent dehydrogenase (short-subunit alcohol dehydrogenase family)
VSGWADETDATSRTLQTVYREDGTSPRVVAQSCDVTDFDAVQRAVDSANTFHERVTDHVVCCAGYSQPGYFLHQDVEVFKRGC